MISLLVAPRVAIVISYIIGMFLSVMQLHGSLLTSYHINHRCPLIEFIVYCKQIGKYPSNNAHPVILATCVRIVR